jgi:hypothetical protein
VFGGGVGLLAGALVVVWDVVRSPHPRVLLRLSAVTMALAPVAWILGNLGRWGDVTPELVTGNPAPSMLVVTSLVLLLVGSWRGAAREPALDGPAPGARSTT